MDQRLIISILFMIASTCMSVVVDICFRFLNDLSAPLLIFFRFFGASLIALPFLRRSILPAVGSPNRNYQLLRVCFMLLVGLFSALSLQNVSLSFFALFVQLSPITSTILGILILKDPFSKTARIALVLSFTGAIIIVTRNPIGFDGSFALIFPVINLIFDSIYCVLGRALGKKSMPTLFQATSFFFYAGILSFFFLPFVRWEPLSFSQVIVLCVLAVSTIGQQIFWLEGILWTPMPVAATLMYLFLPLATLSGIFLFGETINFSFVFGAFFIIAGGFLILFQSFKPAKQEKG